MAAFKQAQTIVDAEGRRVGGQEKTKKKHVRIVGRRRAVGPFAPRS